MIPVLIPARQEKASDGFLCGEPPTYEDLLHQEFDWEEDRPVLVVPPEALQSLLSSPKGINRLQPRFGAVSEKERAQLRATFYLVEEWRTGSVGNREEFSKWTAIQRVAEREESPDSRSRRVADFLARHSIELVDKQGLQKSIAELLHGRGDVRLWWNRQMNAPFPGIFVENFVEGLFVLLLLNLANPESIAKCPRCGKSFIRTKTIQRFCDGKCGNNDRQARHRSKVKNQEEKHGTKKAR